MECKLYLNRNRRWVCYRQNRVNCRIFYPLSECAPSKSFHVLSFGQQVSYTAGLRRSGFVCRQCRPGPYVRCKNCSLCAAGLYNYINGSYGSCLLCPAGNLQYYCWFSHDVTKFQPSELLILLRFYFHDV